MGQRWWPCGDGGGYAGAAAGAGRVVCALPVLFVLGGLAFGLLVPPEVSAAPFFTAAPLIGAALYSTRATVLVGLASVLSLAGLKLHHDAVGEFGGQTDLLTVITVSVLALLINLLVRRGDRQLASVRDIAEAAQRALLPVPPKHIAGLCVAARYEAAQADAEIGGDLYAVQETPHGVRLLLGDVRGKGLDAVETVVVILGAFREAAEREPDLAALAGRLEAALQRENRRREGLDLTEGFTTALLAEIPPGAPGAVRLLNRGHPPPLILSAAGAVRCAHPSMPALPLGMAELAGWPDLVDTVPFPAGSTLLMFTDGVTEARNEAGAFYDPEERLRGSRFRDPERLLDTLVRDVARHTGGRSADDMALLAAGREGAVVEPRAGAPTGGAGGDADRGADWGAGGPGHSP